MPASRHAVAKGKEEARKWNWGIMSALYCESCKALRAAGVLDKLSIYKGDEQRLLVDLASPRMRRLLRALSCRAPLPKSRQSAEAMAVHRRLQSPPKMVSVAVLPRFLQLWPRRYCGR